MANKNVIEKRVEFGQIDTDIEKQKRAARRIPSPLPAMLGRGLRLIDWND